MINGTDLWSPSYTADMTAKTFSGRTYWTYPDMPANLYEAFLQSASLYPDRIAVADDNDKTYTYAALKEMTDQFSSYLYYISGLRKGQRAGLMMYNSIEFCVALLALTKLGAIVIPLPSKYSESEVLSLAGKASLQYIISDEAFYDWFVPLETSGVNLLKSGSRQGSYGFSHMRASYLKAAPSLGREEDDSLILFTSGTTSQSKGAVIKNYSIMHAVVSYQRIFQITYKDVTLIPIPAYLVTGLIGLLGLFLSVGGTVYLHKVFNAKRVLQYVKEKEITFLHSAPAVFSLLLRERNSYPSLPSLRLLACGSSNMSREKLAEIHNWLPCAVFHTVYGLTETSSPATIFPGDAPTSSYIGSSGRPIPGTCFRILDDFGKELPDGRVGEIAIRGTVLLDRYYQKGTGEPDDQGWLRTGDLGYFNQDQYLFIVDRKKDMINRGGEKIWSSDVENELHCLPGVDEAAVVGIPHEIYGEVAAAAVKLLSDSTLTEAKIQELLRKRIAKYMIPARIIFLAELPMTPNQKVDKPAIRKLFL